MFPYVSEGTSEGTSDGTSGVHPVEFWAIASTKMLIQKDISWIKRII